MNGFLTAREAANELGYDINPLYESLRSGTVRAQQFNHIWMIDRQEVKCVKALQGPGGRLPKRVPEQ